MAEIVTLGAEISKVCRKKKKKEVIKGELKFDKPLR